MAQAEAALANVNLRWCVSPCAQGAVKELKNHQQENQAPVPQADGTKAALCHLRHCVGTPSSEACGHGMDVDTEAGGGKTILRAAQVLTELSPLNA